MYRCVYLLLGLAVLATDGLSETDDPNEQAVDHLQHLERKADSHLDENPLSIFCFRNQCRCDNKKADCSQNYGSLTFVPKLPDKTEFLNFSYNNLTAITRGDFFANVSHLQALDLGDNDLMYIHPKAFSVFKNLNSVFVDYNFHLTLEAMEPILSTHTLKRLDLRHGGLLTIPDDVFHRFPLPALRTLYLHENKLGRLNFTTLTPLRRLRNLGMANNLISEVDSDLMVSLERVNLEYSSLSRFPVTCRNGSSLFPRLTQLYLAHSLIAAITGDVCLPRLTVLELTWSLISRFLPDMFGGHRFPSLTSLQLQSQNSQRKAIQANAFRNPSLKQLNLMYNDLSFNSDVISPDSFRGCPNLVDLLLSHSFFDGISHEKWQRLFKPLQKLQTLFLGGIDLRNVSKDAFKNLPSLQKLHLYENSLSDLPDGVFNHLNLTHLSLEKNRISTFKESTFSVTTRNRLTFLDLSGNPFQCTCTLMWFQTWFLSRPSLFSHSRQDYRCDNLPGTHLGSFVINPQACLLPHDVSKFILISVSLVMGTTILASVLFHFRWHIRLLLYEAFRGRNADLRRRRLAEQHFDYDVFVSYAFNDCDWVLKCLRPQLEEVWGLRLCLHQRDFLPGKNIVDNIVDSVQASKKVLALFSPGFAVSPWCQFELNFCLRHVMDFDDALVVIRLRDITSRDMTSTMMAVFKVTTYIQWEVGEDVEAAFWGRLRIAFEEILPAQGRQV